MTPTQLRTTLAVTLSVAGDDTLTPARRLSSVQSRLTRLIDQLYEDESPWPDALG